MRAKLFANYVLEKQRWAIDSCLRINEERSDELILKSMNQWVKSCFSYIIYFLNILFAIDSCNWFTIICTIDFTIIN